LSRKSKFIRKFQIVADNKKFDVAKRTMIRTKAKIFLLVPFGMGRYPILMKEESPYAIPMAT